MTLTVLIVLTQILRVNLLCLVASALLKAEGLTEKALEY